MYTHLLRRFSAGSANDEKYKETWYKSASLFIPQINELLSLCTLSNMTIYEMSHFTNPLQDELGQLFTKYGSDKSRTHNYNVLYGYIINKLGRANKLNILEIGLGTNNPNLVSTMGVGGKPGASLYAFKEFCDLANIYGGDVDKDILFSVDRIKTAYVDQLNMDTFASMQASLGNVEYDLVIDDGLHSIGANFNTLLFALKHTKPDGWIVIEDILRPDNFNSIDYILKSNGNIGPKFETYMIKGTHSFIYAVHKLNLFGSV
jgi:hypothetical protein